ncbi:MAG: ABC transporter permease [Thermoleophilaceae bacterium]
MGHLIQDLRYAVRSLRKTPGFTVVAILTLALGIGANAAIFTVLDRALLRPLPVEEPDRLVVLSTLREGGDRNMNFSYPAYHDYREGSEVFSGLIAFAPRPFTLATDGAAERVEGVMVSGNYFDVLGVEPRHGRAFLTDEGRAPVAVLSHGLWQRRFGADAGVVGRTVTLNDQPFTVVGVAPEGFRGLRRGAAPDLWLPVGMQPLLAQGGDFLSMRNVNWLYLMGRLEPGVTLEQARTSLSLLFQRLDEENPSGELGIGLASGAQGLTGDLLDYERPLFLLMAMVGIVLLIACTNVANLLLARAARRRKEIAMRLSLGASSARLVRQLLTESLVLAALGGAAGLLLALWAADLLLGFAPATGASLAFEVAPDTRVLGFTVAIVLLTALVFGLVPALQASRLDMIPALENDAASAGEGGRRLGLRGTLVVGQVALSLVLLIGAGLFVRSLRNLQEVDLGFEARNVLLSSLELNGEEYDEARGTAFYEEILQRVEALPGVRSASLATTVTPSPFGSNFGGATLEGYQPAPDEEISFDVNRVGPEYFETLEMPILLGRGFEARDREGAPRVAVINEIMAERYWPGGEPIGKRITFGSDPDDPSAIIIGVAEAGKYRSVREKEEMIAYMPILQDYRPWATLLVRTAGDPLAPAAAIRREVRALDPGLSLYDIKTMDEHIAQALSQDRMLSVLTTLFGVLALVLAAVGIYGVMAYITAQRTREVGIRMALGARRGDVLRLLLGHGALLVGLGLAAGVVAALLFGRAVGSLLYGVSASDPATLASVAAILLSVALLASYLPARLATRVDPMVALRHE